MPICIKRRYQLICLILSAILALLTTAGAKPSFSFSQNFPTFQSLTQQFVEKRSVNQMKSYSGNRVNNDSLIMIYYHDSTIAVVELGPEKLLLGCELIEIYKEEDGKNLLEDLSEINRPLEVQFKEMLKLMSQCEYVDKFNHLSDKHKIEETETNSMTTPAGIFPRSPLSILSGIIPGTKWCGTGDIAVTYNDLGTEQTMDRCCRTHDLCPIKIRGYQQKYELNNESLYTKSHCTCDDMLYSCLKKANTSAAQLMGSIYFNLVQVPCLRRTKAGYEFRMAKEGF